MVTSLPGYLIGPLAILGLCAAKVLIHMAVDAWFPRRSDARGDVPERIAGDW